MSTEKHHKITQFIRHLYNQPTGFIPLHAPVFLGNEKKYLAECIDSTFVSYVGEFVTRFEKQIADYTGAKYAIATVNGTTALQIALLVAGVKPGDEVITQDLTFVATANAIKHANAEPVFLDVDRDTMGLSPQKLEEWLEQNVEMREAKTKAEAKTKYKTSSQPQPDPHPYPHPQPHPHNRSTGRRIAACVPMHTFGHPCRIDEIIKICNRYNIKVVEDAAESLGSYYKDQHTGTFGQIGVLSFNGNKTITTGGGGMIITNDESMANRAKHLTTTAKKPHKYEFVHDETGYNYRMPNVNAAIGVAQMELLGNILQNKRETSRHYSEFFSKLGIEIIQEPTHASSNYWLNAIVLKNMEERDAFLTFSNENQVMTRPVWQLMHKLQMYSQCMKGNTTHAEWLEEHVVNLPSSYRTK